MRDHLRLHRLDLDVEGGDEGDLRPDGGRVGGGDHGGLAKLGGLKRGLDLGGPLVGIASSGPHQRPADLRA
jgi:hypothetical protein